MLLQKSLTVASRQAPQRLAKVARGLSTWGDVAQGPADPILGLTQDFNNDTDPRKVSVGAGAYRGEDGKPWVLPSVREAEQRILDAKMNHEYLPISGDADFVKCSLEFLYGADCGALAEGRIAGAQALSGTGALCLAGHFLSFLIQNISNMLHSPQPQDFLTKALLTDTSNTFHFHTISIGLPESLLTTLSTARILWAWNVMPGFGEENDIIPLFLFEFSFFFLDGVNHFLNATNGEYTVDAKSVESSREDAGFTSVRLFFIAVLYGAFAAEIFLLTKKLSPSLLLRLCFLEVCGAVMHFLFLFTAARMD